MTFSKYSLKILIIVDILIVNNIYPIFGGIINNNVDGNEDNIIKNEVHRAVHHWSPLVFLAPGERFFPSSVPYFLQHTVPSFLDQNNKSIISMSHDLPSESESEKYFLSTRQPIESLLSNKTSFLYGQDVTKTSVPVYAVVKRCNTFANNPSNYRTFYSRSKSIYAKSVPSKSFHVTYWFFYPFNLGKSVCTVSLGPLGQLPFPQLFNKCLGVEQIFGNHVGDWEHITIYFKDASTPDRMYVSTHEAGAFYKYDPSTKVFFYQRQDSRKGILQKPEFPKIVHSMNDHPVLYSAKGSHGLWSKTGSHRYLTVARIYDEVGNGIPWRTWENLEIIDPPYTPNPVWLKYKGKWGNPKNYCNPFKKVFGIHICTLSDGPTGIPLKRPNFVCPNDKLENYLLM